MSNDQAPPRTPNSQDSATRRILRRLNVARRFVLQRPIGGMPAFDNEYDRALVVDPLWNHIWSDNTNALHEIALCGTKAAMTTQELINIYRLVKDTERLSGAIAEVGVFRGGSARLIALANGKRRAIHLFDTFAGLPEVTAGIDNLQKHQFAAGLPEVEAFLSDVMEGIEFHIGFFPESANQLPNELQFSFVNLDMDTYASTKNGFEYFYPRLQRGGVIVCHDYFAASCPGVKRAVDEFMNEKPERIIGLWHSQAVLLKQ
jgi:O-methyltransferase